MGASNSKTMPARSSLSAGARRNRQIKSSQKTIIAASMQFAAKIQ